MRWDEGKLDEALRLYDERVWADGSSENLSLCNDISMLARLEIAGVDVGARWDAAAGVVRELSGGSVLAFVDAHYALATGELPRGEARGTTARVNASIGRALCEAAVAWRSRDHARVVAAPAAGARRTVAHRRQPRAARPVHADPARFGH